ncbi:F-box protein [Alphaproteobacteria bacterium]|nr:F-box protein [Alphaproteobacteria bacterium]
MTHINLLNEMIFMNTVPLLRNAFVALSLGAFLISPTYAAQSDDIDMVDVEASSSQSPLRFGATAIPEGVVPEEQVRGHIKRIQQPTNSIVVVLPPETLQHIFRFLSVRDGVSLRETCYAFYHALSDTRFNRAFKFGTLLHSMYPPNRSPEFAHGITDLPLALPGSPPSLFREGLTRLHLENHPHALPEGLLAGVPNLRSLYLSNHPHALPEGFLAETLNLIDLYLENHPHALPEGLVDNLRAQGVMVSL